MLTGQVNRVLLLPIGGIWGKVAQPLEMTERRWLFVFNEELLPCPLCGEPNSFFLPPCLCDPGWTLRPGHRNPS